MIDDADDACLAANPKGMMMTLLFGRNASIAEGRAATEVAVIRPSDMRVFGELRGRRVKLSVVHRELGVSRQAVQRAVDRVVAHGVLAVEPAADSRGDEVVSITGKERRRRTLASRQIREIDAACAEAIGRSDVAMLRRRLDHLVEEACPDPRGGGR